MDDYEYVMHGKVFKFKDKEGQGHVKVQVGFSQQRFGHRAVCHTTYAMPLQWLHVVDAWLGMQLEPCRYV